MSGPARSVLVTGASGFLAAWTIEALAARGTSVTALDLRDDRRRLGLVCGEARASALPWVTGDINEPATLDRALERSGADAILHLAALTIPACRADPVRGAEVDVIGHIQVMEAARRHKIARLVYTSSAAAHPRGPLKAPANLYGVFKRACEDIAKVYAMDHGLMSVGVRPQIVYGLGRDDGETAAITKAIRAAALGEAYEVPFRGTACFQYAGEIAEVLVRCLDASPRAPVVSDITTTIESTDDLMAVILDAVPHARVTLGPSERAAPDCPLDRSPLERLIGPWPRVGLDEGVRATIDHYRRGGGG
ncbi:NAD-dependent epimerase/dehydratase family protein [Marinimicrococcus flavescens]|uniref:NAD(P)-dependent oxidoreductase n=1 Tax=Marinimicrococcus flavescens TaxID=3031815 RepID=A0AAP3XSD3_9PROT|nr:NAD(P)-dependent oxidoreductase [Marinimicrococcus flavescens]